MLGFRLTLDQISERTLGAMLNNSALQKWDRLRYKQLSQQFLTEIINGLGCSPFEAQAILDTVHRVFRPYYETSGALKPGQLFFDIVSQKAPSNLPLKQCPMVTVVLTLDAGEEDLKVKEQSGVTALRRHRLERTAHEAFQQGGLLTVEDLAHRLFNCGERTLCRDLAALRKQGITLPLRSTIKDMGRSISHRALIVEQYLAGKEYTTIARSSCHSVAAVRSYIEKFKRTVALMHEGYDLHSISFLVRISPELVKQYRDIYNKAKIIQFRQKELEGFLKKDQQPSPHRRSK
ncbi:MAG: DUF1670 domain-containing protein [Bacteroidota bacterium]